MNSYQCIKNVILHYFAIFFDTLLDECFKYLIFLHTSLGFQNNQSNINDGNLVSV